MGCRVGGTWFCEDCDTENQRLRYEVARMTEYLGEHQREAPLVLSASSILEAYERVENSTSLGKAATMARARELIAEVEDHFTYTPWCPLCKSHKLELVCGDPLSVTCTGKCDFG